MRHYRLLATLFATVTLSTACSWVRVYRIDIPQGAPLTAAQAEKVKAGMTPTQVKYVLGSPSVIDPLHPNHWEYVYHYLPGTYARQAGLKKQSGQRLVIEFGPNNTVESITGLPTIPAKQPGLPGSRDLDLQSNPL